MASSSNSGLAHPPRSNPPLRFSSGPPFPCTTPSTETCVVVVSFMIAVPFSLGRPSWAAAHPYYEHLCPDPTPPPGLLSRLSSTPVVNDPTRRSHRWTPAPAEARPAAFAALRRTSTFRVQAFDPSVASLSATSRSEASMIQKSARYFSFPTWVGLGHTAGTGRSSSASPMSRASVGCILRAPGRPVDLDRYALREGSRFDQVKRYVRAGVGE